MTDIEVEVDIPDPEFIVTCEHCSWSETQGITARQARYLARQHVYHTGHTVEFRTIRKEWFTKAHGQYQSI